MKKLLLASALLLSMSAHADTVRTSDGITCSFDADDTPWSLSGYTERADADSNGSDSYNRNNDESTFGVKVEYRFGGPKRLECDKLYQLELRSKDARVQQLEAQVEALKAVGSIDW